MKVLLINFGYSGGGAERTGRNLFQLLPQHGVDCRMWIGRREPNLPPGVEVMPRRWEYWLSPLEALPNATDWRHRGSTRMIDALTTADFDLVHLHVIHSGAASIQALHRLCQRMPVVWTLHDEWAPTGGNCCDLRGKISPAEIRHMSTGLRPLIHYDPYHENFRFRAMRGYLDRWLPQPRVVAAPSQYMLDLVRRSGRFPHAQFRQIIHGLPLLDRPETTMDRAQARRELGLPADKPVVLLVGQSVMIPHKGMAFGCEVLTGMGPATRPHVLVLGRDAEALRPRLPGLDVTCGYAADDAALARAYRAADVTLIPSLADNMPFVAVETLACSTPFVAFRIGGLPEAAGEGERGRVAEPFDRAALRENLRTLLASAPLRQQMGDAGRRWAQERCTTRRFIETTLETYALATSASATHNAGAPNALAPDAPAPNAPAPRTQSRTL